jgi:hypothetical protein
VDCGCGNVDGLDEITSDFILDLSLFQIVFKGTPEHRNAGSGNTGTPDNTSGCFISVLKYYNLDAD